MRGSGRAVGSEWFVSNKRILWGGYMMRNVAAAAVALMTAGLLGMAVGRAQTRGTPGELPGYFQYSPAELRAYERTLGSRMNAIKQAAERLGDFGNHQAWVAHREGNGLAEIHQNWADLMFVISGEATLVLGGEIENPSTESPGEIRGAGVRGGVTRVVKEGEVINVPAGMPHRFMVRDGSQITFFTMKIEKAR